VADPVHRTGVARAGRLAHDDRASDQLDPRVVGENAGLAHAAIFLDAESPSPDRESHRGVIQSRPCRLVNVPMRRHDATAGAAPAENRID
jgi:hypothetical protein